MKISVNGFMIKPRKNCIWQVGASQSLDDFAKLKVPELKVLLRERGLPVSGKKAELIARIQVSETESPLSDETQSTLLEPRAVVISACKS